MKKDPLAAQLKTLKTANQAALETLSKHFGPERWAKLVQQAERHGLHADDIAALAGKMVATRNAWHPNNAPAALHAAACGFLIALGSTPSEAEVTAYDSALASTAV